MKWPGRAAVVVAALLSCVTADANALGTRTETPDTATVPGAITGVVTDAGTGMPIAVAYVRLLELNRAQTATDEGRFHFPNVPAGRHTVVVERIGYSPASTEVTTVPGGTATVELTLRASALVLPGVIVTGGGRARRADEVYQPTAVLSDAALQRALGTTVTATIEGLPGIHQQYNGPAASQPVIRGMGGDRVLVLEDGQRSGDLYSTAPDHAVAIDPLTAERIEVVRGPAGLLFGSNALGGVINVVREEVPASLPDRPIGTLSAQGESAYRGLAGGGSVVVPLGRLALRAEFSGRSTDDARTPLGVLESSALRAVNAAGAASLITGWGHVGVSARHYQLDHGVPGEFAGEAIPGAHPGGVEIESRRTTGRLEAVHRAGLGPFGSIELTSGIVHYVHDEIEGRGADGQRWIGTSFDQLSGEARLVARHHHLQGTLLREGAVGLHYRDRDLRAGGSAPGLRSARERAIGAYIYEELGAGPLRLQLGARYDLIHTAPYNLDPIIAGRGTAAREVPVTERTFGTASGSIATLWNATPALTLGVNLARSFRPPSIGELFSDGPHLADYSFDIGNPALGPETGHGADVFARISTPRVQAETAVFVNALSGYIYHEATGELDRRFGRFPVFQARSDDALFRGAEGRLQWQLLEPLVIDATWSYVAADRRSTRDPLPSIPPLSGSATLRYEQRSGFLTLGWRGAAAQRRVPDPIESAAEPGVMIVPQQPTDAYGVWNAGAGVRWTTGAHSHSVSLNLHNAFDAVWRDHLSRTKDIAPQTGRNVQLLYRVRL
jgi:iron complex outermembrane recepter protein